MHVHLAYARLPRRITPVWDREARNDVVRAALRASGVLAVMPLADGETVRGLLTVWINGETATDWRASRACTRLRAKLAELAGSPETVVERGFQTVTAEELEQAHREAS